MSVVKQYRPITTLETGADDGYSPRILRDHADNLGNAVVYALAHPVLSIPCFPPWYSHDNTTDERVIMVTAEINIAEPYTKLAWTVCHEKTAESAGDDAVTWRLYTSNWAYWGDGTFDATKTSPWSDSAEIVSDTLNADTMPAPETVDITRKSGVDGTHLILTAQNDNVSTRGCIKSITVWPVWL